MNQKNKAAKITELSDRSGVPLEVCNPAWFNEDEKYKINNAPPRTGNLTFPGGDLNFLARVLYAESSGSNQLPDKIDRQKEKTAILNVIHFRLNRTGYPRKANQSFRGVCEAPGQFESVNQKNNIKFTSSKNPNYISLAKKECLDLMEALEAVRLFLSTGPTSDYIYDNFRAAGQGSHGQTIGKTRFWLSTTGIQKNEKEL